MLYVKAKILDDTEDLIYKRYMADGLKYVTESISQAFGGKCVYVSFFDLINSDKKQTVTKTGEEIAADVIKKAGLVVMSD